MMGIQWYFVMDKMNNRLSPLLVYWSMIHSMAVLLARKKMDIGVFGWNCTINRLYQKLLELNKFFSLISHIYTFVVTYWSQQNCRIKTLGILRQVKWEASTGVGPVTESLQMWVCVSKYRMIVWNASKNSHRTGDDNNIMFWFPHLVVKVVCRFEWSGWLKTAFIVNTIFPWVIFDTL